LFVTGLLHDMGKMLIAPYLNNAAADARGSSASIVELEQEIVGLDHTEAGALVAAKWNLSNTIQEVIKEHHHLGTPETFVQEVAVVRLADAFAHGRGIGYLPDHAPDGTYMAEDLDALNLTQGDWEQFCAGLDGMIQNSLDKLAKITS
ncbi:MAG: HDOD domain-containing protein, partial [Longimicrobiales bacterium]